MDDYLCQECMRRYGVHEMFDDETCKGCHAGTGEAVYRDELAGLREDINLRTDQRLFQVRDEQETSTKAAFDQQQEAQKELADREMCRRHLLPYVQRKVPEYEPGWVHADICKRLEQFAQDIIDRKSPRLMLFLPPRAGKSELGSKQFPSWFLGKHPELDVIISSYSGDLAEGFSRAVRNSFSEDAHQQVFPQSKLAQDSKAAAKWHTKSGGAFNAVGVNGTLSGKGGSLIIVDDPHKDRAEAESDTIRQGVKDWYSSTLYTRRAPGAGVLVIQTRWHEDDLSGWLLEKQKENEKRLQEAIENGEPITEALTSFDRWEVVSYPAIALEDEPYRRAGEALNPERFPLHELLMVKNTLIPRDWEALYQQRPISDDGDFITKEMFRYYKQGEAPDVKDLRIVAAADLAISQKQTADYSVFIVAGIDQNQHVWILDMRRGRWNALELIDQMFDIQNTWVPTAFGIESGQIELTLEPFIAKAEQERGVTLRYTKLKTKGHDKQTRALPLQGRMQQGRVHYPHPDSVPWGYTLQGELLKFPLGKNDDIVDALAWVIQMILQKGIQNHAPKAKKKTGWRDKYKKLLRGQSRHKSHMSS